MKNKIVWNPQTHGITKSLLEVFRTCSEKGRIRYLEMLGAEERSEALDFGNLTHEILSYMYGVCASPKDNPKRVFWYDKIYKQLYEREFKLLKENEPDTKKFTQLELTFAKIDAVLPTYFEVWQRQTAKYKWLDLEKEFEFELKGIPIRGKIDGVYEYKDELYIFETKTKGQVEEDPITKRMGFEIQVMMYYLACKELYGRRPKGINYNVIRRPAHRLGASETLSSFRDRLTGEVRKSPEHFFIQFHHTFRSEDVKRWRMEFKGMIEELKWRYENDIYYRDSGACKTVYGTCPYLDYCAFGDASKLKRRDRVFSELELL